MSGGSSILPKGAPEAALHDGDGRLDHLVTAENIGVVLDHTSLLNARKKAFVSEQLLPWFPRGSNYPFPWSCYVAPFNQFSYRT